MRPSIEQRMSDALAGSALAGRLAEAARPLLERRGGDAALQRLDGPVLVGLARAIASRPETAGFLSHRPALLERLAEADAKTLERQGRALAARPASPPVSTTPVCSPSKASPPSSRSWPRASRSGRWASRGVRLPLARHRSSSR